MKKKKIHHKKKMSSKGKKGGKKNVKAFLRSEKGKISKRSAAKLGMGILAAGMGLSGLMKANSADACWDLPTTATTATTAATTGGGY